MDLIHRSITNDVTYITGYHTQENRVAGYLAEPVKGKPDDAWLGVGYYFWVDETFAHFWGPDHIKKKADSYEIYKARIDSTNLLNASFDEKEYFFFKSCIEKAIEYFKSKGHSVSLLKVNRFLSDHYWPQKGITGIIFDDLPHNNPKTGRIHSEIEPFYYNRRIQIVVFDLKTIV